MLDFKSICWIWLAQPTPKQQLDSLYLSDTSPLFSKKLALPVQGSPVWDSCGSSPHSVAGQPALVCPRGTPVRTAKLHPARSTPLPQLHWLCGFTIITWTIYRWITSLPISHHQQRARARSLLSQEDPTR
ncbi:hypothetical protein EYF80_056606 [Liparis tanakae]|uniref:Uncharacterized protein n=1 Tax=Liparis tanakae TaxID=230148 RepID=A0A4Z2EX88_9TELE|nr:hypothetical protein EYF80_056606 [Liparis tanakae]